MGSFVLERIDLRLGREHHLTTGPTGLDEGLVVPILSTMTDRLHALATIQFRRPRVAANFWESMDQPFRGLIDGLHAALRDRVADSKTKCGFCEQVLVDTLSSDDLLTAAGHDRCTGGCGRHACSVETASECATMGLCIQCDASYCADCRMTGYCDVCGGRYCDTCVLTTPCDICGKSFCAGCKWSCFCDDCGKPFCEDCRQVNFCDVCQLPFCEDCRVVDFCDDCDTPFCEDCRRVNFCDLCQLPFCEDCRVVDVCDDCDTPFCADCRVVREGSCTECHG